MMTHRSILSEGGTHCSILVLVLGGGKHLQSFTFSVVHLSFLIGEEDTSQHLEGGGELVAV